MKKVQQFWLNDLLTRRFRLITVVLALLVVLAALWLVARSFGGFTGTIRHSYHEANDMSEEVGTSLHRVRIR